MQMVRKDSFYADVVLEIDMKLYREEEHEVILDVYTPAKQCIPEGKSQILEKLLVRNFSKCRLADRIEMKETQGKILQICHSQGRVKIDKTRIVEGDVQVDGIVQLKILYIVGNDDMPFYSVDTMLPLFAVTEASGIQEDSTYYLHADLEQLATSMVDSDEIEIRATVSLNLLVMSCQETMVIDKVEEQPLDEEKVRAMPGITVYVVKPEDSLWDIAKKFYTTVEEICTMNQLKDKEISVGQPLLLVKKVEQ